VCKLLFLASNAPVIEDDKVAYKAWAKGNPDGIGVYCRLGDKEGLYRFARTRWFKPLRKPYDRLLIHFRLATQGEGTHPFLSCDRRLVLAHNGVVFDDLARIVLENQGHKFRTNIDSEVLVHLLEGVSFSEEGIAEYAKRLPKHFVHGQTNIIAYDRLSDKWLAISDGGLWLTIGNYFLTISSQPLFEGRSRRVEAERALWGRGTRILGEVNFYPDEPSSRGKNLPWRWLFHA